jgi:hypothetical protein
MARAGWAAARLLRAGIRIAFPTLLKRDRGPGRGRPLAARERGDAGVQLDDLAGAARELPRGDTGEPAWIQQWYQEPWQEHLQMEVERLDELDDGRVLALLTLRARGRGSGARVETEYAHITVREGLAVRVDGFPGWKRALAAARLGGHRFRAAA